MNEISFSPYVYILNEFQEGDALVDPQGNLHVLKNRQTHARFILDLARDNKPNERFAKEIIDTWENMREKMKQGYDNTYSIKSADEEAIIKTALEQGWITLSRSGSISCNSIEDLRYSAGKISKWIDDVVTQYRSVSNLYVWVKKDHYVIPMKDIKEEGFSRVIRRIRTYL